MSLKFNNIVKKLLLIHSEIGIIKIFWVSSGNNYETQLVIPTDHWKNYKFWLWFIMVFLNEVPYSVITHHWLQIVFLSSGWMNFHFIILLFFAFLPTYYSNYILEVKYLCFLQQFENLLLDCSTDETKKMST